MARWGIINITSPINLFVIRILISHLTFDNITPMGTGTPVIG